MCSIYPGVSNSSRRLHIVVLANAKILLYCLYVHIHFIGAGSSAKSLIVVVLNPAVLFCLYAQH